MFHSKLCFALDFRSKCCVPLSVATLRKDRKNSNNEIRQQDVMVVMSGFGWAWSPVRWAGKERPWLFLSLGSLVAFVDMVEEATPEKRDDGEQTHCRVSIFPSSSSLPHSCSLGGIWELQYLHCYSIWRQTFYILMFQLQKCQIAAVFNKRYESVSLH